MNFRPDPESWFSIFESLEDYDRTKARRDVVAGVSAGVVLVPQAMAYAVLGGLPPVVGLYASIVPLFLYAICGGSRHVAFGIVAIDMLILVSGLGRVVDPGDPDYVTYAFILAAMVGGIQLLMVAARLGFIVNLLAKPVIVGFTTAAPILIALSQLDNLLGVDLPTAAPAHETLAAAMASLPDVHEATLAMCVGLIIALYAMRAISKRIPDALVVVAAATLASWWFGFDALGVETLGAFETGFPTVSFIVPRYDVVRALLPTAITIALVQYMALMSIAKTFGVRAGYRVDPDRELRTLGIANFFGSFFQSPPVSGSFSRSTLNYDSDAATPLNNAVAAAVVIVAILLPNAVFESIPMPALSAIIIVSALGMIVPRDIRALFRIKRADGLVALVTIVMTLVFGIQEGVLLGIGSAMALILYRIARPSIHELGRDAPTERWQQQDGPTGHDVDRYQGIIVLRVDGSLTFVNAEYVRSQVEHALVERDVHTVVLDLRGVNDVDATAEATLEELIEALQQRHITLFFSNMKDEPYDTMKAAGLFNKLSDPCVFPSSEAAVDHIRAHTSGPIEILPPDEEE